MSEADRVREALFDDFFVDNATYGRLVEEAAEADELSALRSEVPDDYPATEGPTGVAAFLSGRYV